MVRWQWGGAGLHPLQLLVLLPAAALAALQVLAVELLQGSRAAAGVGVADAGRQVGDDPLRVVQVPGRPVPHGLLGHKTPGGGSKWVAEQRGRKAKAAGWPWHQSTIKMYQEKLSICFDREDYPIVSGGGRQLLTGWTPLLCSPSGHTPTWRFFKEYA